MTSATSLGMPMAEGRTSLQEACGLWYRTSVGQYEDTTRRDYRLTLRRCVGELDPEGVGRDAAAVAGQDWFDVLLALWGRSAASTWNRNRAAVAAFLVFLGEAEICTVELPALCKKRKVTVNRTKAKEREDLAYLWAPGVPLRERTLWRVLYESSSRAEAVMALDVEDVDFGRARAKAVIKGGDTVWVHFEATGAALLREYIGERRTGPLWLTNRRPRNWRSRPASDRAADGRRYRLSYDRAEHILKRFSGGVLTPHILRHSRLTHLSEDGVQTPMLMAVSGHKTSATLLDRYARPTSGAVQRLFADRSTPQD